MARKDEVRTRRARLRRSWGREGSEKAICSLCVICQPPTYVYCCVLNRMSVKFTNNVFTLHPVHNVTLWTVRSQMVQFIVLMKKEIKDSIGKSCKIFMASTGKDWQNGKDRNEYFFP